MRKTACDLAGKEGKTVNVLILVLSILAASLGCDVLRKAFCRNMVKSKADLVLYSAVSSAACLAAAALLCVCTGKLRTPSARTVQLAALYGMTTAAFYFLNMKALEMGPLSYTSVIVSCDMALPTLSGALLFGEKVSVFQWIGAGLMLLSVILAANSCGKDDSRISLKWLLISVGACITGGMISVFQKIHQHTAYAGERDMLLNIAFSVSTVLLLAMALNEKRKGGSFSAEKQPGRFLIYALTGGIAVCISNKGNLYLSGVLPAVILFPVFTGARMLLTVTAGFAVWKEKLSRMQWAGLMCGAAAILLLCGVF